ncbi:HIR complex subunit [Emydomyces testavorans]|uniref:HIR complex subunit n=1 Tax=Emydomyces testavorans TaxID=2070801 RepID=A0AAF0IH43_9EURO|nr:HIR complex subunit [Emydomyces testavorans]
MPTTKDGDAPTKREAVEASSPGSLSSLSECESIAPPAHFNPRIPTADADDSLEASKDLLSSFKSKATTKNPATSSTTMPGSSTSKKKIAPATSTDSPTSHSRPDHQPQPPAKPKRSRKRKDEDAKDGSHVKPRRQRNATKEKGGSKADKPAGKNPSARSAGYDGAQDGPSPTARKKQKLEHLPEIKPLPASRQSKITDLVDPPSQHRSASGSPQQNSFTPQQQYQHHHHPTPSTRPPALLNPQNGSYEPNQPQARYPTQSNPPPPFSAPPPPLQRTSGQHYDPVRSSIDNHSPTSAPSSTTPPVVNATLSSTLPNHNPLSPSSNVVSPPPLTMFRASASPAISSIIDPPEPARPAASTLPSTPAVVVTHTTNNAAPNQNSSTKTARPGTNGDKPKQADERPQGPARLQELVPMDIDSNKEVISKPSTPPKKDKGAGGSNAPASGAPSPKPTRAKEAPPLPSGSGLLTSAAFGLDASSSTPTTKSVPNIILHVPLKGQNNVVINFARLAEEQYGFDALHPRVAAQRERRARLAAASAALEKNEKNGRGESGAEDDLSLDADRDSDVDADVIMSGTGGPTNQAAKESVAGNGDGKKRRRKMEEYDRDDPFVDDSELIWEEQAATSRDGFFVYSGPLVPEGEKPSVERADGTVKRGRGRGGRLGATGESRAGTAGRAKKDKDAANKDKEPKVRKDKNGDGETQTKEKPKASRAGAGATRKPRMTKADRALMEKEKAERESLGMGLSGKNGVAVGGK